ncbi:MAG: translation initiation factor IF-2 [Ilumatobacteraceae bacterium]|nr:translation initiation factor IF-2 [Ilumatobacteraceae bacterium]
MANNKVKVSDLAKSLGMSNAEMLELCKANNVAAKTPQSTLVEAFVPMLKRKAQLAGLVRDVVVEEEKPAKKVAPKSEAPVVAPVVEAPVVAPVVVAPVVETPVVKPVVEKPAVAPAVVAPVVVAPVVDTPVAKSGTVISARATAPRETPRDVTRESPRPPATDRTDSQPRPVATGGAPATPTARQAPPPPGRPVSPTGRPVPPPPGRPMSATGRPVPPPPGGPRTAPAPSARPSGTGYGGPRTGAPRPAGAYGTPRPGAGPRPAGAFGAPRPGGPGGPGGAPGAPGGAPGGPGGGRPGGGPGRPGGPRPSGGRRAPRSGGRRRRRGEDDLQASTIAYSEDSAPVPEGTVVIERGVSSQEFGPRLNRTAADVVRFLFKNGEIITATMTLNDEQMELFAIEIGAEILLVEPGQQEEMELQALFDDSDDEDEAAQELRPPVITVMGHVDHGKTTLLDKIRNANVVAGEAGGITQHIGAYQVLQNGKKVTFIDTPGHAAFTQMRARGAQVTDIVVLMVAADDGVMPQTIEAISHARAAGVPMVVAINKVDKENADVQRVLAQLAEQQLVPESWGGDTICVEMSAQQNLGVDDLIEQLTIVAEVEELTANPTGRAKGVVLEANLDTGRGPVATVLVDKGTLRVGDPIVAGGAWGRVRAMIDDKGQQIKEAGPSTPVQVLGLSTVPQAGDEFRVAPDEKTARTVGEAREHRLRAKAQRGDARVQRGVKLEDVFSQIQAGEVATLNLVLKADVQGSLEAVTESLRRLERDEVKLAFVHRAVGGVTENDITLAAATNATIIAFNVRPDRKARDLAEAEHVEIRSYEIIYKLLEDIESAMVGMLAPEYEEIVTGEAEVRDIFRVPKLGAIAGCYVRSGQINRGTKVRFIREGVIIWKGAITSLRRFKDDVREVREGFECGIGLSDFQDLKPGDLIETFEDKLVVRT